MNEKLAYGASVLLSAVALVLLVANVILANANRTIQLQVSQRQNVVGTGQTLSQVNQGLVQAMAEAALKNNDAQMRDLLASQGITVKSEPAPAAAPASTAKPAAKK